MEVLNHRHFYDMLLSGANEIIHHQKELNDINVFPVADGDTGNNLAHLMGMIKRESKWSDSSKDTLETIKLACMRGSRGNSGMIFSQFIITMCNFLIRHPEVNMDKFIDMCNQSVESAVNSVSLPQEGTVLTVMKSWVISMKEESEKTQSIHSVLKQSYPNASKALEKTKTQMEVFRIHNVVDAGAKGFIHFLQGLIDVKPQSRQSASESEIAVALEEVPHVMDESDEIPFRYCSEFLVELNPNEDINTVKSQMAQYGDSIVMVSDGGLGKIHLHTNDPSSIAEILVEKGNIVYQKVEDMRRQYESIYQRKASIALVVDSACDIPQEWMDAYQIYMLPLQLEIGKSTYLDKVTLQSNVFYDKLDASTEQPKSSQPSLMSVESLYKQLLQQYDSVVSLHVSQKLSGTFDVCEKAAQNIDSSRIHVINSRTLSGAYGLIAYQTAKALVDGSSIDEVKQTIDEWIPKSEILVSVPTLKHMIRGGRVSPLQGKVARWLNMKPIVSIDKDGNSLLYGKTFFSNSSQGKMFKQVKSIHEKHGIREYVLLHAGSPESMKQCKEEMTKITGVDPLYTTNVSPVIGGNAGKGAVSVAMILNEDNLRNEA
jgi:DegV family protein with EDD domain